ncbi:ABC transporter ATP-binding protein [Mesorhizobium sp. CAU 1732]|uniref:ABC transporter ATP-binding protein n=1 Tax=Mesorhizobium sp. CAU 1732 TaxID=3140358 RepID=UPI003260832E
MTDTQHLEISNLKAWYGDSQALHGVSLSVSQGEVVALLGRNGAGKSTIMRSIAGVLRKKTGSIKILDRETLPDRAWQIARMGLGYVPEERGIFASLSVAENLNLPPLVSDGGMSREELFVLFPNLVDRLDARGTSISGGEQQMLSIARVLRAGARLILLDEPTEGLAPVIVQQIGAALGRLKAAGYTVVLVEQNLSFALAHSDRQIVIENGQVVDTLTTEQSRRDTQRVAAYLSA